MSHTVTLSAQISCVKREIAMRERLYPQWVADGKMTGDASVRQIAAMKAVLATLMAVSLASELES